jgi:torulene dioxygenase
MQRPIVVGSRRSIRRLWNLSALPYRKICIPISDGPASAAHAKSDPVTSDFYNFNLAFAPQPTYRVFCVSAASGQTTILATIPGVLAYLHSLFLTQDYILLCVWNSAIDGSKFVKSAYVDAVLPFDATQTAKWYVVDRKAGQGLIATYETPAFFCFHTVNAWQEPSKDDPSQTDIVAELVKHDNLDILKALYYENLISNSPAAISLVRGRDDASRSSIARFRLPHIPTVADTEKHTGHIERIEAKYLSPELPMFNPSYACRPHRYTYAMINRNESTFFDSLMKFDSEIKEARLWHRHGHSPSEAIFVANPNDTDEDSGVLLSVVLVGTKEKSYL